MNLRTSFGFRYLVPIKIKSTSPYWTSSNVNTDDAFHGGIFRCDSDVFIMIWCNFIWLKTLVEYPNRDCSKYLRLQVQKRTVQKMSRIAIVTGANKGIGLETTRALAKSGLFKRVYLTSRNVELGLTALKGRSLTGQFKSCDSQLLHPV